MSEDLIDFDSVMDEPFITDERGDDRLLHQIDDSYANNDYQRMIEEQQRLRGEYLKFKAQRRLESAAEHELNANLTLEKIKEMGEKVGTKRNKSVLNVCTKKSKSLSDSKNKLLMDLDTEKPKPLSKIDTNVMDLTKAIRSELEISDSQPKNVLASEESVLTNRFKLREAKFRPEVGATTVLIKNLSKETNEYKLKELGETFGVVLGVCVALEGDSRRGMIRFKSSEDALAFQTKFDDCKLDSTVIKTRLI